MALSQAIGSPPLMAIDDSFESPSSHIGSVHGSMAGFHRLPARMKSDRLSVNVAEIGDDESDDGHSVCNTYKCSCCDVSSISGSTLKHEDFSESTFLQSYRKTTCESSYSAAVRFAKMIELLSNVSVEAFSLKDFYEKVSIEHETYSKVIADLRSCYHRERHQHKLCQGHLHDARHEIIVLKETHEKEVSVLKETIKDLRKEVTVISKERDVLVKEVSVLKETHEKEIRILKEHHEKIIKELREKFEKEISIIREEHKSQIIDIERKHEVKIVDIRKHYETRIVDIEKKHETTIVNIEKKHEVYIKELKEKHETTIKELKEHRETIIRELKEKHEVFVRDIKEKHETFIRELKEKHETSIREISSRYESVSKEYKEFKHSHELIVKELKESHEKFVKELKETHKTQIEKTIIDTTTKITTEIRESSSNDFDCERKDLQKKHRTAISWWKTAEETKAAMEKHYRKEIEELRELHETEERKLKYQLAEASSSEDSHHHHSGCGCSSGGGKQHSHSHTSTSTSTESSSSSSSTSVSVEVTKIQEELTVATSKASKAQTLVKEITHERDQLQTKVKQLETDLAAAKAAVKALPAPAKKPTHGQGGAHSIQWIMYHNQLLSEETHVNGTSWIHKPFARDLAFNVNENLWDAVSRLAAPGQSGYHVDPKSLGCDPARGKTKTMIVAYHTAGSQELQYAAAVDGDMLRFPAVTGSTSTTAVNKDGAACVEEA